MEEQYRLDEGDVEEVEKSEDLMDDSEEEKEKEKEKEEGGEEMAI